MPDNPMIVAIESEKVVRQWDTHQGHMVWSRHIGLDDRGHRWQWDQKRCIGFAQQWLGPCTDWKRLS